MFNNPSNITSRTTRQGHRAAAAGGSSDDAKDKELTFRELSWNTAADKAKVNRDARNGLQGAEINYERKSNPKL